LVYLVDILLYTVDIGGNNIDINKVVSFNGLLQLLPAVGFGQRFGLVVIYRQRPNRTAATAYQIMTCPVYPAVKIEKGVLRREVRGRYIVLYPVRAVGDQWSRLVAVVERCGYVTARDPLTGKLVFVREAGPFEV